MSGLPFVFANPWGALALLGIPVVIAIHCLQQKSRILPISTLFLLDALAPDSKQGRQITRLRSSLPFWMQILCVLLLTWLLVEPRWLEANAVQRVVIVLDSSVSMRAFTDDIGARTEPRFSALAKLTPRTYYTLLETDPSRPTLYEGFDLAALELKLQAWKPSLPAHDPTHALELARALAPRDAVVIFLTDRPHEVPSGVDVLAIGEPIENSGLVGSRLDDKGDALEWQVMVQNYGAKPVTRGWWLEFAGQKTGRQTVELDPGHPQILKGKFPPGVDQLEVCLDPDRFPLDDRMSIVRPKPKQLTVQLLGDDATTDIFARLAQTIPALAMASPGQQADIAFLALKPAAMATGNALSFVVLFNDPATKAAFEGEPYVMEDEPLNQDLNWQGLVTQPVTAAKLTPQDHVLLWKDRDPLIYLRALPEGRRQLVFNFNFATSNAARLPAFILLVHRFVESLRLDKKEPENRNAELAEPLTIAADAQGGVVTLHDSSGTVVTAPARALVKMEAPSLPGFFTITQGDVTLVTGSAEFADARESDFKAATTLNTLADHHSKLVQVHTRAEVLTPLWLILIGIALVIYWRATSPRKS